jgi:hypothetical protein
MNTSISIYIEGPAYKVTAYVINNKILKEIEGASDEDALYEGNKYSLVSDMALDAIRVSEGFCIYESDNLEWSVTINEKEVGVNKVCYLNEGVEYAEEFDVPRNQSLVASFEDDEWLGADLKLKRGQMFMVEVEDVKLLRASVEIEVAGEINLEDLRLGVVDLDVLTDVSSATYLTGILNGMEKDVRYLMCGGVRYEFEFEVLNSYPSRFYSVRKTKVAHVWEEKYLG